MVRLPRVSFRALPSETRIGGIVNLIEVQRILVDAEPRDHHEAMWLQDRKAGRWEPVDRIGPVGDEDWGSWTFGSFPELGLHSAQRVRIGRDCHHLHHEAESGLPLPLRSPHSPPRQQLVLQDIVHLALE